MGFVLLCVYLSFLYLFPAELIPELRPYRIPFWTGVVGLLVSVPALLGRARSTLRAAQPYLLLGLTASMALSVVIAERWLGGALMVLEKFGVALTMFFLVLWNVQTTKRLRVIAVLVVLLAIILVGQGVAAYHFGYQADLFLLKDNHERSGDDSPEPPARIRALGLLNDPNDLAVALLIAIPFLWLAWSPGRTSRNTWVVLMPTAILIYGIFLTRSRGALISLSVTSLFATARSLGKFRAGLLVAVLGVGLLAAGLSGGRAFSTSEESAAGRLDAWSEGWAMFTSSPILGVGYGNFVENNELTAHNSFVLCLAELGLVGYFFWGALIIVTLLEMKALSTVRENPLNTPGPPPWERTVQLALTAYLIAAFFLSRTYNPLFFLLLAVGATLMSIMRQSQPSVPVPSFWQWTAKTLQGEALSVILLFIVVRTHHLLGL